LVGVENIRFADVFHEQHVCAMWYPTAWFVKATHSHAVYSYLGHISITISPSQRRRH
jgi:hypothetical protein